VTVVAEERIELETFNPDEMFEPGEATGEGAE
jgi:hypothetical protein